MDEIKDARTIRKIITNEARALYNTHAVIEKIFASRYPNINFILVQKYSGELPEGTVAILLKERVFRNDWLILTDKENKI